MTDSLVSYIGKKFKKAREECNLTQQEVADRLGIGKEGYGHYERNIRTPSIETLLRLSEIFEKPITYFLPNIEEIDDPRFNPQLRTLVRAWPHLSASAKEAILALARGALDQVESPQFVSQEEADTRTLPQEQLDDFVDPSELDDDELKEEVSILRGVRGRTIKKDVTRRPREARTGS
jgi:transcriptional regulator with XRE-family HTH domain